MEGYERIDILPGQFLATFLDLPVHVFLEHHPSSAQ